MMFNLFPFFFSVKCESLLDVENQVIVAKEEIRLKLFIDKAISSYTACFFKGNLYLKIWEVTISAWISNYSRMLRYFSMCYFLKSPRVMNLHMYNLLTEILEQYSWACFIQLVRFQASLESACVPFGNCRYMKLENLSSVNGCTDHKEHENVAGVLCISSPKA